MGTNLYFEYKHTFIINQTITHVLNVPELSIIAQKYASPKVQNQDKRGKYITFNTLEAHTFASSDLLMRFKVMLGNSS